MERKKWELTKFIVAMAILGTNGLLVVNLNFTSEAVVIVRTGLGAMFLGLVSMLTSRFDIQTLRRDLLPATLGGLAVALNWLFLFAAYKEASVSLSILLCYCGPMVVLLLSPLLFREKLTPQSIIAGVIVAVGMWCMTGWEGLHGSTRVGMLYGLISGGFYALLLVCNKSIKHMESIHCTLYQLVIASLVICVYSLTTNGTLPLALPRGIEWLYVFVLGVVNTGVAYALFFSAIKKLSGQTVALMSYIEPLTALLVSAIFLGERLLPLQLLGAICILGGTALGNLCKGRT